MGDRPTILVIDDEPAILVGLAATIRRQGYHVITASNGKDGLDLAKTKMPDLILSDVMMPPPNGFEVRRILSQDPQLATIPFIFLTARVGVEDRVNGIRGGADDYITKPFLPDELMARIAAIFRRIEAEQARGRDQMKSIAEGEMNALRHEILQNIHHEFRTPLTNVIMPLQAAVNLKFDDPQEQVKFIRTALSNLDRLEALVTDFIILTNIDHGDINTIRQPVDPDIYIVKPTYKRLDRYKRKELKLNIDIEVDQEITAPRKEFSHAIVHLIDNAFKFSPDKGTINLLVKSTGNGGSIVRVTDEGPGIDPGHIDKVFERYYQISQGDSREYEGLGVGLTIAKTIAENSGGQVEILPVPSGCCIQMEIPSAF